MSKSNDQTKTNQGDAAKALHTSMQPFHFAMDFFNSVQNYNRKNADFLTKRFEENLKSTGALLGSTDPNSLYQQSHHWWHTFGTDYMAHFADSLTLSHEISEEIGDLVDTEVAISNAKPQEIFENSPV